VTEIVKRAVRSVVSTIAERAAASHPELSPVTVGTPVSRVDGHLKATGAARYPADVSLPNLAHAVLVPSTIARGRITRIALGQAATVPGVLC
jgi:xanthine dehydrogenase YagR molybdenum-binding subunit